jgi:hypothetical protein
MNTKVYTRIAKHPWRCSKCGTLINKGQRYKDVETKTYFFTAMGTNGVNISHERSCICCSRTKLVYPEIMATSDGIKERVLGVVMKEPGNPQFLTQDWCDSKYHFRSVMLDYNGNAHYAVEEAW